MSFLGAQRNGSDREAPFRAHPQGIREVTPDAGGARSTWGPHVVQGASGATNGCRAGERPDRGEHAGWAADPLAGATATLETPRHLSRDRRGERGARDRDRRAHLIASNGILGERWRGCRSRVARVRWCSTGFERATRTRDTDTASARERR